MRTWLYNRIANLPGLADEFKAADHILSSGAADSPGAPFLMITMGSETPPLGLPRSAGAQDVPFTIWVHDEPGSMVRIDDACVALKDGVPSDDGFMVGAMSVYGVKWEGTGDDSFDDHFGTNCRPVRFSMMTRR